MQELTARLHLLCATRRPEVVAASIADHGSALAAIERRVFPEHDLKRIDDPRTRGAVEENLELAHRAGARWLMPKALGFPKAFDDTAIVCFRGDLSPYTVDGAPSRKKFEQQARVAIVGARLADNYGVTTTRALARALGESRVSVVSGLAKGIDTAAHQGALDTLLGRTYAILGDGICAPRGKQAQRLVDRIVERGGVYSEYPITQRGSRWSYPQRNRLIARLADAVVVAQCFAKGGSMLTAELARKLGRPLYAIPGDVLYELSAGPNQLLSKGHAKIVTSPADLADVTGAHGSLRRATFPQGIRAPHVPHLPAMGEEVTPRERILDALRDVGSMRLDELDGLGLGVSAAELMFSLELEGVVQLSSANRYELR